MDFRLLGPLEVLDDAGRPVPLGTGRQRALLTLLLLRANELVASERLVDELWGAAPPATALKMLHNQVATLRRSLGRNGRLETQGSGYRLNVAAGERDVDRFEQLVAQGRARMGTDPHGAAEAFRQALRLWRGPALSDVAYESFARTEIAALEERRWAVFEARVEAELELGLHADLVAELETAVVEEPLRERLHGQLMLALYRCGRQADALEAYSAARRTLVEQIGVEPGPELRALHAAILAQDPALSPPPMRDELPAALAGGSPLLAGRSRELAILGERLAEAREGRGGVVLVGGPAGIGKTRLAAELAREALRRGVAVVYLGARDPAHEALAALRGVQALERPVLAIVDDADAQSDEVLAGAAAFAAGASGRLLLVLHQGAAPPDLPGSRLELGPLAIDPVAEIARLYRADGADGPALAALAIESEGIPLAVHRAAARWARAQVDGQLVASAGRSASERAELSSAELHLVGDVAELQAASERARLYAPDADGGTPGPAICPFLGLATFDTAHADYFFGRERLVAELVARLVGSSLLAVVGPSGSGKSSAVRAGLLPALAAGVLPGSADWRQAVMRPGAQPLDALERALDELGPDRRSVLVVDQFEETFTACRHEDRRAAFLDALVALAGDPNRRVLVVLAVRADFYGRCAAHDSLARLVGAHQVLVGAMRADELRRAIELPAARVGLRVETSLTDALIADVRDEPGGLPLLSAALLELWRERRGAVMHRAAYDRSGGVRGAVGRLAEETYSRLDEPERHAAKRILMRLADAGDQETAFVRRQVPLAEIEPERDEPTTAALEALTDSRLVTVDDETAEVAHEALLREWPRLRSWLEEDAEGRRLHRHLIDAARDWRAADRDPGELYRGARLAAALDWSATHADELHATERAFVSESTRASERSQRRLRAGFAGIAALLVLAVLAGATALEQRGNARSEATVAEGQRVAADAQRLGARALVEDDLDRALLLARQGVALDDTVQTRGNLLAALLKSPAAIGVLRADTERILSAALSPDERTLAVGNIPGRVSLFDTRTRRRVTTLEPTPNGAAIHELAFSPDGSRLAVAHAIAPGDPYTASPQGIAVTVLDARSHRTVTRLTLPTGRPITGLRFSRDANTVEVMAITGYPDGASIFMRFDARTGRRLVGPARVNRSGYSPLMITGDGRRMVVVGYDGVTVRDAATLAVLERFPGVGVSATLTASPLRFQTVSAPYALSSDDRTVAIGDSEGALRLLDLETGNVRTASGRHAGAISEARFTPDGRSVITTGDDGAVIVWDARRAKALETLSGHAGFVFSPMTSRDGTTLYTASLDGTVLIWDLSGKQRLGRPLRVGAEGSGSAGTALSSDGQVIAVARRGGVIGIVDARSLHERRTIEVLPAGEIVRLVFVPRGRLLVAGGDTGRLALVDAESGRVIPLRGHRGYLLTPGMSADGRLLVTASVDGTVRLWSLPDGRALGSPLRFPHGVYDAQVSPDGRRLALLLFADSGVPDTLEVWDVRSRRRVISRRPGDNTNLVRFSPDGRLAAVGNNSGRAQVWSTATWKPVSRSFAGHAGALHGAAISPDTSTLATGGDDGTVRLWDVQSEQAVGAPLPGLPNHTVVPSFTPDGTHLLAGYETGDAYLWDIRPGSLIRHACRTAGRQLTRAEWQELLPGRDYDPAC